MRAVLTSMRHESGQAMVLVAVILAGMVGMAALVVDVGSWYPWRAEDPDRRGCMSARRRAGSPRTGHRADVAMDYAQRNYAGASVPAVTFPSAGDDQRHRDRDDARDLRPNHTVRPSTPSQVRAHARAAGRCPG